MLELSSECDLQVISKQSEQQQGGGLVVKQQSSEQPRKHNKEQQQQYDGQQQAAGSSHPDQQQSVGSSSNKASGSNGEVRGLDTYSSKDMTTMGGYVNKDGSTYSKDLLDLCTSVTPPPASQPSTTAATTMAQVTLELLIEKFL